MDLVLKDMGLFDTLAQRLNIPVELSPMMLDIFRQGAEKFGNRAWSSQIVKRMEDACDIQLRAPGFPEEMVDHEPDAPGKEVGRERSGLTGP